MIKLLEVKKSNKPEKKYMAIFELEDGRKKVTHFGQAGARDFLLTGDKDLRKAYRARHKKDLETNDYTKPGYLSYYLLWGNSTSLTKNIEDYKKMLK